MIYIRYRSCVKGALVTKFSAFIFKCFGIKCFHYEIFSIKKTIQKKTF